MASGAVRPPRAQRRCRRASRVQGAGISKGIDEVMSRLFSSISLNKLRVLSMPGAAWGHSSTRPGRRAAARALWGSVAAGVAPGAESVEAPSALAEEGAWRAGARALGRLERLNINAVNVARGSSRGMLKGPKGTCSGAAAGISLGGEPRAPCSARLQQPSGTEAPTAPRIPRGLRPAHVTRDAIVRCYPRSPSL